MKILTSWGLINAPPTSNSTSQLFLPTYSYALMVNGETMSFWLHFIPNKHSECHLFHVRSHLRTFYCYYYYCYSSSAQRMGRRLWLLISKGAAVIPESNANATTSRKRISGTLEIRANSWYLLTIDNGIANSGNFYPELPGKWSFLLISQMEEFSLLTRPFGDMVCLCSCDSDSMGINNDHLKVRIMNFLFYRPAHPPGVRIHV